MGPIPPGPIPQTPAAAAHPQPPQMEIPSLRAPDIQLLVQDLAQSRRDLFEERKNSANRIAEERERSRWEMERLRVEFGGQIKSQEKENEALIRAVGRIQGENDHLREENAILRLAKANGHVVTEAPVPAPPPVDKPQDISSLSRGPQHLKVPLFMPSSPMPSRPVAMPPGGLPGSMPGQLQGQASAIQILPGGPRPI